MRIAAWMRFPTLVYFHAEAGAGRYMLALVWYKTLTGKDIAHNKFNDFDEPVSELERKTVIEIADMVVQN